MMAIEQDHMQNLVHSRNNNLLGFNFLNYLSSIVYKYTYTYIYMCVYIYIYISLGSRYFRNNRTVKGHHLLYFSSLKSLSMSKEVINFLAMFESSLSLTLGGKCQVVPQNVNPYSSKHYYVNEN